MIIGLGNDIIDIRRIERTIERFGDRFLRRIFTAIERERSARRRGRSARSAQRLAPMPRRLGDAPVGIVAWPAAVDV